MIRPARAADLDAIVSLIRQLAEYENLAEQMVATPAALREHLFQAAPTAEALVATTASDDAASDDAAGDDAPVVGYALFFPTFSTFKGRPCLHLEDLYVAPESRGRGHGKALLGAVARIAEARGCPRLDWNVLSWNQPAIEFYEGLGATVLSDWWLCRAEGDALRRMAGGADRIL